MRVDFQIVHSIDGNLREYLLDLLKQTFDNSTTIDFSIEEKPDNLEDWSIFNWIEIKYNHSTDADRNKFIAGFSLDIDENNKQIIREYGNFLSDDENIDVVFKYFDEPMLEDHKNYAEEIYKIEMKLRETISYIFIDTYKDRYYDLLKEINVKTQPFNGNNKPDEDYFKSHLENEFFFLLFSDYVRINDLKKIDQNDLMEMIKISNGFDELKQSIQNRGIIKEKYKELIASIKENLKPIEDMRNCIAHNRSFTDITLENYQLAKEKLDSVINQFWEELENES